MAVIFAQAEASEWADLTNVKTAFALLVMVLGWLGLVVWPMLWKWFTSDAKGDHQELKTEHAELRREHEAIKELLRNNRCRYRREEENDDA